jgi:hypothetical protein
MKANLYAGWITGIGTIALFVYWIALQHESFNPIWCFLIMCVLALLSGNFFGAHRKQGKR